MVEAYVYCAALLCSDCGEEARRDVANAGLAPADPENESSYDSDQFPKGPYPDGGGEADAPQHCDHCGTFLQNPLTADGDSWLREQAAPYEYPDDNGDVATWEEVAQRAEEDGHPALAECFRYYFAEGQ
jgi:hypothetical protein